MAHRTLVINVVGLNASLIGDASPRLRAFRDGAHVSHLVPDLPAVTCTSQASMLTGAMPAAHGIVGNGWYDRDLADVQFWKQSNHLVRGPKVWETARSRDASVTCAKMFWWYNMYSSADWSVTPRPIYKADGRKIPNVYAHPAGLDDALQRELGRFPLFNFWGPAASIASTTWIAESTMRVDERFDPTLTLVYLPHLDYALQKLGPDHPDVPAQVAAVDAVVGRLLDHFEARDVRVMIVSEYGIEPVDRAVSINRVLRDDGHLAVRVEDGRELLDPGAGAAFAVADHQIAHVYVNDASRVDTVRTLLESTAGIAAVLDRDAQRGLGLDHARAGELLAVASPASWFAYRYWEDDARAPDFARTVDIHRKPGYDPLELFIDPALSLPRARIAWTLLKKKLGFRSLLEVIPLDPSLVRGSHGRVDLPASRRPLLMHRCPGAARDASLPMQSVHDVILAHLFDGD
ncbi:MAG: alkaline phosphatase family protein [Phycisphaerales bacterium]|nr:alkaline phosphatase family protein [Phycisphaerales bacterium]